MNSVKKLPQDFFKCNIKDSLNDKEDEIDNYQKFRAKRQLPIKKMLTGSRNKSSKVIVKKGSWNWESQETDKQDIDSLKLMINSPFTTDGPNYVLDKNNKNSAKLSEKQDIVEGINEFQEDQQIMKKVNSMVSLSKISYKQSRENIKPNSIASNLKVSQNTQNLNNDNDVRLFQELYNKSKLSSTKLYKKSSRESSRDSRATKLQENGIKALGMKLIFSPTKIEEKGRQESSYPSYIHNSNQKKVSLNLWNQYINTSENRNVQIFPERPSQIIKDSSIDDLNDIFNMNLAKENMADKNFRCAPNFKINKMKKKRSQSENRNRNYEFKLDSEDHCEYFMNKLKSTIKLTDNKDEDINFFSKRKAIQHSNSSKVLISKEDLFKHEKSLSEKKPHPSSKLLSFNDSSNVQVPTFNLNKNKGWGLKQNKFEKTWQFGGLESFNNTANSSFLAQDELSSVGTNCDKKMHSITNLLVNHNTNYCI